jgi:alkylation response protein AidB-like acyl-CoA dehydrogenase
VTMEFSHVVLCDEHQRLRHEVRAFTEEARQAGIFEPGLALMSGYSPAFSQMLGERHWVGMSIPAEYGGNGTTAVDRFVVAEELVAAGAPISAHWAADRQIGPSILRFGSEEQRRRFLPGIAAGRSYWSQGLSEPEAGSDLASLQTRAVPTPGGWVVNGRKIWTSRAQLNHYVLLLCRTSVEEDRHAGISQLIVPIDSPGVHVAPIALLNGERHFNEITFADVFVPDELVLGQVGRGWQQISSELVYERSGPDRFLTTYPVFAAYLRLVNDPARMDLVAVGSITARIWALRNLALSVAASIDAGRSTKLEAAIVRDLGGSLERDMADEVARLADVELDPRSENTFVRLLAAATLIAPTLTIRGGTTEIVRVLTAKEVLR